MLLHSTKDCDQSFSVKAVWLWNALPINIKQTQTITRLKKMVKEQILCIVIESVNKSYANFSYVYLFVYGMCKYFMFFISMCVCFFYIYIVINCFKLSSDSTTTVSLNHLRPPFVHCQSNFFMYSY